MMRVDATEREPENCGIIVGANDKNSSSCQGEHFL
jgi:hypothetical protein